MNSIFLDTNVILDLLIREEYKSEVKELILKCSGKRICISFLTVANVAYIMRKYPKDEIYRNIGHIITLFDVIENDKSVIERALNISSPDFEDVLQYQTAIKGGCDVIVTRNKKDFQYSEIPVMTALELLAII